VNIAGAHDRYIFPNPYSGFFQRLHASDCRRIVNGKDGFGYVTLSKPLGYRQIAVGLQQTAGLYKRFVEKKTVLT
jgi:hypothetical protein